MEFKVVETQKHMHVAVNWHLADTRRDLEAGGEENDGHQPKRMG